MSRPLDEEKGVVVGRPNVVLLMADQQKATSLSMYGNRHCRTPHLDSLATRGVVVDQCRVQSPFCVPSRTSLSTGRYPTGTRCHHNEVAPPADEVLLQEMLNEAGYRTAGIGHLHGARNLGRGWDVYSDFGNGAQAERWRTRRTIVDEVEAPTQHMVATLPFAPDDDVDGLITTEAIELLDEMAADQRQPFFLHLAYISPHPPYFVASPYDTMYEPEALDLPPREPSTANKPPQYREAAEQMGTLRAPPAERRRAMAHYYGMNSYLDDQIGRLIAHLAHLGLAENTIIVYTSDHGDFAGEHDLFGKTATLYDCLLHVPLVIAGPEALVPHGLRLGGLVESIDIVPTLLDLLDLTPPAHVHLHGDSLRRLWEAPGAGSGHGLEYGVDGFDVCYADIGRYGINTLTGTNVPFGPSAAGRQHPLSTSLRTPEWKYIHTPGREVQELYNVASDPGELYNLYGAAEHDALVQSFRERLLDWQQHYV